MVKALASRLGWVTESVQEEAWASPPKEEARR
jgi:hypothetical protein